MTSYSPKIWIGTSGYQYDHWREVLYPADMQKKEWLAHYQKHFSTVEINNTFYNLPDPDTFIRWREQAAAGFCYVLKFSRYGTHMKKLKDPEEVIDNFIKVAGLLEDRLGPILLQLPPHWKANPDRLESFLRCAPQGQRFAVEFRDTSWLDDSVFAVLEKQEAALVVHDMIPDHPDLVTADWVYYRFHGKDYGGNYSPQKLSAVADRLAAHHEEGRDVFAYFNNDLEGHAVHNALDLMRYVRSRLQAQ